MRLKTLIIIILVMLPGTLAGAQEAADNPPAMPSASQTITMDGVDTTLSLYFSSLKQGRAGLIQLDGAELDDVEMRFLEQPIPTFSVMGQSGVFGLLAIDRKQAMREYPLTASFSKGGQQHSYETTIQVTEGGFIQQNVLLLDEEKSDLIDPELNEQEIDQIVSLASQVTPTRLWTDAGFQPPVPTELTSPFGAVRQFNYQFETWHTGWDYNAHTGMPLRTAGAGRVAFAGFIPIRGNYVLIDHGHGIYSGYAHLSVIHVTQGQTLYDNQIIGQVGTTGRSSSAHAHFEFLVNGIWVDSADMLEMWLP